MLGGGSRIPQHLRDCDPNFLGLGFGFYSSRILSPSAPCPLKPLCPATTRHRLRRRISYFACVQSKSPGELPIFTECFSQQEDDRELPSEGLSPMAGGIVALGKFDALHIGHRELAIQASKVGAPFLLSFVGMAEVLGWEPRAPIVAKCDRRRVLSSWASYCGNMAPEEFQIEFSSVRHLTPRQFVEKLSKELRVHGVVAGKNYRFGYKASGDTSELVRLCEEYGMGAYIINSVMDKNQESRNMISGDLKERGQVSSTRVRHALAVGEMKYVSELLGRQHRLILILKEQEGFTKTSSKYRISASKSCLLNLAPKEGLYENCSLIISDKNLVTCRVFIDKTHIHLEMDEVDPCNYITSQDLRVLGIEFSGS